MSEALRLQNLVEIEAELLSIMEASFCRSIVVGEICEIYVWKLKRKPAMTNIKTINLGFKGSITKRLKFSYLFEDNCSNSSVKCERETVCCGK